MDDFRSLVDAIHAHGMQCMIDVVYNHTAPDSWLREHHPEWFHMLHDYLFKYLFYAILFGMWVIFVEKIRPLSLSH